MIAGCNNQGGAHRPPIQEVDDDIRSPSTCTTHDHRLLGSIPPRLDQKARACDLGAGQRDY